MTGLKKLLALIASHEKVQTIGGLPVLVDNARFPASNGQWNSYETSESHFLTGWYDTGTIGTQKTYTFGPAGEASASGYMTARWFDDKDAISVDYWRPFDDKEKTIITLGRFIVATVYKPTAAGFYLYNNTDGKYVFKGNNVT